MKLEDLGYNSALESYRKEKGLENFAVGRVVSEHKERYDVKTENEEYDSELIGNLRFTAEDRNDFPAVGDWVAISEYDEGKALIHAIYPRSSIIERQAVGKSGQKQIIATNIDFGLIVQAVDRDFNVNRLERYLTICHASDVTPIIVLSKTDLIEIEELEEIIQTIHERIKAVVIVTINNQEVDGYQQLNALIQGGKTYCLLGSSGVGKSTLSNSLSGRAQMKTGEISSSVNKGKHVTSHRELIVIENGGILIDNPGMREVGITDSVGGLEMTFDEIMQLASSCRFNDCTHINEAGCAILEALDNDELDEGTYDNYLKMEKEKAHFESSLVERRSKDKHLGKLIKGNKKDRNQNKY